jgi:hypothetical protein
MQELVGQRLVVHHEQATVVAVGVAPCRGVRPKYSMPSWWSPERLS